ncbi:hypothetical protein RD792_006500, partial [Penstemon davidsonii]
IVSDCSRPEGQNWKLIMASQGRIPPPHLRRPLPGPGVMHPDPYGSATRPPPGGFPHFEMLPPPVVMEQKLSAQHIEIEKLAKENQRLANTHGTLRHDLATANNELQLLHNHIADVKDEKEHKKRGIIDKISMMEAELEAARSIKMELQQARAEVQSFVASRQELISKVQQLTRDLQMAHSDAQQIPSLISGLDSLRQEYQHYRATYDYEKKLYNDHLESLQVMEKNYMAMSREVEKLRAELTNTANFDPRTGPESFLIYHNANAGGPYAGYSDSVAMGNYASGQNAYAVGQQGQTPLVGVGSGGRPAGAGTGGAASTKVTSPHVLAQSAPASSGAVPDTSRGPDHSATRGPAYDAQKGHTGAGYDPQRVPTKPSYNAQMGRTGPGYDAHRGPIGSGYDVHWGPTGTGYDAQRGPGTGPVYDAQRGLIKPSYGSHQGPDTQKGSGNDVQRGTNYDMQKGGPQGQVSLNNATPSTRAGSGYEPVPRGGNPVRRHLKFVVNKFLARPVGHLYLSSHLFKEISMALLRKYQHMTDLMEVSSAKVVEKKMQDDFQSDESSPRSHSSIAVHVMTTSTMTMEEQLMTLTKAVEHLTKHAQEQDSKIERLLNQGLHAKANHSMKKRPVEFKEDEISTKRYSIANEDQPEDFEEDDMLLGRKSNEKSKGMQWGLRYILQGIKPRTFEELATRAHDMELSLSSNEGRNFFPIHESKKGNVGHYIKKGGKLFPQVESEESMTVNISRSKSKKNDEMKNDSYQRSFEKKTTLKDMQKKEYPFLDSDVAPMLDDLLEAKLIELPEMKRPKEAGRTNDRNYCKYHRLVGHPIEKYFVLKDKILQLAREGKILLDEDDTTANLVTISFGCFDTTEDAEQFPNGLHDEDSYDVVSCNAILEQNPSIDEVCRSSIEAREDVASLCYITQGKVHVAKKEKVETT